MTIDIQDSALEARIRKVIEAAGSTEEALARLLDTQEEQDRWIEGGRAEIWAKIRVGMDELRRGETVGEDELDDRLRELKIRPV